MILLPIMMGVIKMNIDKEKFKRMMQNKKFITIIGVLMLVLGVSLSYVANYIKESGYIYAGNILGQTSQVCMLIFIALFAYAIFALDKQLTETLKKRKEAIEAKLKSTPVEEKPVIEKKPKQPLIKIKETKTTEEI
jgi:exosortase/archaeosortase